MTEVQDILPKFVELCDLNKPPATEFNGLSLASVLRGEDKISDDRMPIINFSRVPGFINHTAPHDQTIVRKEGAAIPWKTWCFLESRELDNLETDPMQKNNVYDQNLQVFRKIENQLDIGWERVKEVVNEPQKFIIDSDKEYPSFLTALDWLDVFIDQQPG